MAEPVIPDDVRQFLLKNIDSVAQWEALLLLRTDSQKEWEAGTIARHIYVEEKEIVHLLAPLAGRSIIKTTATPSSVMYRYAPASDEQEAIIKRCASLYKDYLIPMTNLIHSKSKIQLQTFADAFRMRKD